MSDICIYINLKDEYLTQWFIHEQGGTVPVQLTRGSIESKILETYLSRRPDGVLPELDGEGKVAIAIPTFRKRPPEVYNFLPKRALASLISVIRDRFDVKLWKDLHQFGKITRRQDELIYAWMEKNGIELSDKNWNAVAKRYQRQRAVYNARERSKSIYDRKKKCMISATEKNNSTDSALSTDSTVL